MIRLCRRMTLSVAVTMAILKTGRHRWGTIVVCQVRRSTSIGMHMRCRTHTRSTVGILTGSMSVMWHAVHAHPHVDCVLILHPRRPVVPRRLRETLNWSLRLRSHGRRSVTYSLCHFM